MNCMLRCIKKCFSIFFPQTNAHFFYLSHMMKNILCTVMFIALINIAKAQEARLLRFPAVHGNQVVFSYAGDLYTVARTGGVARRMTSNIGYEMFPRFSHDGKQL